MGYLYLYLFTPDTTQTGLFCRVWCGRARQQRNATAGHTPTKTNLSGGQFTLPHQTRQDCRACQSTAAAATQARQAATPSRPTAHTQRRCTPRKCKHAVNYTVRVQVYSSLCHLNLQSRNPIPIPFARRRSICDRFSIAGTE